MFCSLYIVEFVGEFVGSCDCCCSFSWFILGFVYGVDGIVVSYFFYWIIGVFLWDYLVNMDFIVGKWGEGVISDGWVVVLLIYFENDVGLGVMVIDVNERFIVLSGFVGRVLWWEEVIGINLVSEIFGIFDVVFLNDLRL